jgi:four helix bundle protein
MRLYSFEKLNVWQKARELNKSIYLISNDFPKEEKFGLTSQIRRASISISSNIAEGSSRKSSKEQARYTEIAYGSLLEVLNQLILANDLKYIDSETTLKIRELIEEIGNKLNKLKESQINRHTHNRITA